MKIDSLLNNRPALATRIDDAAEVAGYLWQKGWAERNGGNLTLNVTADTDNALRALPALGDPIPIGRTLPHLKGAYFFCKGTNLRMRDLARRPMENGAIIRILDDAAHYVLVGYRPIRPTSELAAHLSIHNYLIGKNSSYRAVLHTHPTDLVAMTHHAPFLEKNVLTRLLWSMIPETRAFCPLGLGIIPYALPGSFALADATVAALDEYDVVMWEKHGVTAVGETLGDAFDKVDTLSKSAQIYLTAKGMGFEPQGMTDAQMAEMKEAFGLPK
jgi:rhamnulose-1-phosphate aldolase